MKIRDEWVSQGKVNKDKYLSMYEESISDNDNFWKKQATRIDWDKEFTKVKNINYSKNDVRIKWYEDGFLNSVVLIILSTFSSLLSNFKS